jgi:hypothetical protein
MNPRCRKNSQGRKINMAIDNLLGATVRIRRGWHGGRTGEVIAFDHQVGPSSYTVIKVQLKGNGQPVMIYSLDELERVPEPPSVLEIATSC